MLLLKKASDAPFKSVNYQPYWIEIRTRALRSLAVMLLSAGVSAIFYDQIWALILLKIRATCPDLKIVSRSVLGPASLTVSLSLVAGLIIGGLWTLIEFWRFLSPALFPQERVFFKRLGLSFLVLTSALQYICFAWALPYTLSFLLLFNKSIVESSVDLVDLLFFALSLHKGIFLLSFWPYILFFLVTQGWLSIEQLRQKRPFIYVSAFIMGMLVTPPDVISQCFVAIPLILIYESVLIGLTFFQKSLTI